MIGATNDRARPRPWRHADDAPSAVREGERGRAGSAARRPLLRDHPDRLLDGQLRPVGRGPLKDIVYQDHWAPRTPAS